MARKKTHLLFAVLFSLVLYFDSTLAKSSPLKQTPAEVQKLLERAKTLGKESKKTSASTPQKEKATTSILPILEEGAPAQPTLYAYRDLPSQDFYSKAVFIMDIATKRVLFKKNQDMIVPIASLSKIMAAMVVQDTQQNMEELITITQDDIDMLRNTRSRLSVGLRLRRKDALLLALMSSENRAANALARHYPGGLAHFVDAMNRKAKSLGMLKTQFVEPTGLSSDNISTPRELALMLESAYQYPMIREFSTTRSVQAYIQGEIKRFRNTNPFIQNDLESMMDIELSKTGYIRESGFCLGLIAMVNARPVIVILINAASKFKRTQDLHSVQNWLYSFL